MTGEYLVLEGAKVLALPVKLGQTMSVTENSSSDISWLSKDPKGNEWFSAKFSLYDFKASQTTDEVISSRITKLLKACARQDSEFLSQWKGQKIETKLEFEKEWGLGTSSTLVYCIAEWADANPYQLLMDTFGGSGYDIACAGADGPILYSLNDYVIELSEVDFKPSFKDKLFFVYLGQKQDTQKEVQEFLKTSGKHSPEIKAINDITSAVVNSKSINEFGELMLEHEKIISKVLARKRIQEECFQDFNGIIKSLGAWGGDFIMAISNTDEKELKHYFNQKGLNVVFSYDELILRRK